jgi:RNA polymerase sigma factor (TIGR02999 family)
MNNKISGDPEHGKAPIASPVSVAPSAAPPAGVTDLLVRWQSGDPAAFERLIPLVYRELRQLARNYLRQERGNHTLQSTALVHEAYLRLAAEHSPQMQSRAHFLALAARVMRHILVDYARSRDTDKRGSNVLKVTLGAAEQTPANVDVDVVALDDALQVLAAIDSQQGQVVELRFFGGLSIEETAEALGISPATVKRDWSTARVWLFRELDAANPT